jgi:energy-coupling factor transporter ATP-binding protein EcfA2
LLLHLNGLLPERPTTPPAVHIFGTPVAAPNLPAIRAQVGLLFQDPDDQLFCPTVREDVAFGPQQWGVRGAALDQRVDRVLAQVGLVGYQDRLPHHLSRGEKRRVCLAGVLACDARVLALDEPTSDLDPRGKRELKAMLQALAVTQIIATHDLELVVELCGRVMVLDRGAIIAEGAPQQVFADEPLMLEHGLEKPHILRHLHPH